LKLILVEVSKMCTYLLFARPEYFQISVVQLFYGKELAES
jgi:hypothetical protein